MGTILWRSFSELFYGYDFNRWWTADDEILPLRQVPIRKVTVEDSPQLTNYQDFRTPITLTNLELTLVRLS